MDGRKDGGSAAWNSGAAVEKGESGWGTGRARVEGAMRREGVSRILFVGRFRTEAGSSKMKGEIEQGGGEHAEDVLDCSTVEGPGVSERARARAST